MTYATLIDKYRRESGDKKRRVHVDWIGDGATTVFQMPLDTFPVLDDSSTYTVKVNGVTMTETTQYTLDKATGTITFVSTPTNGHAVTIDSIACHLSDADWLTIINDTILSMGDDFFKEFVDLVNFTTTANMTSLSLVASQPNCIAVYEWLYRKSTNEDWRPVDNFCNWRYDRDNNTLYNSSRDIFTVTGELFKVRGLKTYTLGDETTDTIDVQDRFLTIVEYGTLARYWRWRYKDVIDLVSKFTTENTRTALQEIIMLSDRFDRSYEAEKAKLKPQKPARNIPVYKDGAGRP